MSRSDFEKLCICIQYVKTLKFKIGVLESTIDELQHQNLLLKEQLRNTKLSPSEKTEIKRGMYYTALIRRIKRQKQKIAQLRNDNSNLLSKYLKAKGFFDLN